MEGESRIYEDVEGEDVLGGGHHARRYLLCRGGGGWRLVRRLGCLSSFLLVWCLFPFLSVGFLWARGDIERIDTYIVLGRGRSLWRVLPSWFGGRVRLGYDGFSVSGTWFRLP